MHAPAARLRTELREARALFLRPQPFTLPMLALFCLMPFYLYINARVPSIDMHCPELGWDALFPVRPAWTFVYLSLFLAAILPVFVVHQPELLQRVILAFIATWLSAYAVFLLYPTTAPLHTALAGRGFAETALRATWDSDVPRNCFPSLHVAQCFLAAYSCDKVHRGVGRLAFAWAALVGLSTLYTKQHYLVDVIAGLLLATVAARLFIHPFPREAIPEAERRLAPLLAVGAALVYAVILAVFGGLFLAGWKSG